MIDEHRRDLENPGEDEIPRVLADESTKLFRTRAQVFGRVPNMDYRWQNPVPVYSGPKLLGAAVLEARQGAVYADLLLDYETPERLDIETGSLWVIPDGVNIKTTYRVCECGHGRVAAGQVMTIGSLRISREPGDPELPPIGEPVL